MVWGEECSSTSLRRRIQGLGAESLEEKELRAMIDKLDDMVLFMKRDKEEKILPMTTESCVCLQYMDKGYAIYSKKRLKSR